MKPKAKVKTIRLIMDKFITIICVLFLGGCVSGPEFSPDRLAQLNKAAVQIIGNDKTILYSSYGNYWNYLGFNDFRSGTTGQASRDRKTKCFIVLSNDGIFFLDWIPSKGAFETLDSIERQDIRKVVLDKFGRNRAVVIDSKTLGPVSLNLQKGASFVDSKGTEAFYKMLMDIL